MIVVYVILVDLIFFETAAFASIYRVLAYRFH